MVQSIELECTPGRSNPDDLILDIVDGTVLESYTKQGTAVHFNDEYHRRWKYPHLNEKAYRRDLPILRERIIALHQDGVIIYGSW
ncbi:MAG TPA: hypothetical protein VFG39_01045 [Balneolaceae bacterium]|nr:hypothetical protein [Balneolaceae bacterium]